MCRVALLSTICFILTFIGPLAGQPQRGPEVPRNPEPDGFLPQGSLDAKELARARFQVSQAKPRDLAQARLDAAIVEHQAWQRLYSDKKVATESVLRSALRVQEARQALSKQEADRAAVAEARWRYAYLLERWDHAMYEAGRIPIGHFMATRLARLEAEQDLNAVAKTAPSANGLSELAVEPMLDHALDMAKERFEASQRKPEQIARARLEAACSLYDSQLHDWSAGKLTVLRLYDAAERALAATIALNPDAPTQLAAMEQHWLHQRVAERSNGLQFETGRIPIQDLAQSKIHRINAEIGLLEFRAKYPQVRPASPPLAVRFPEGAAAEPYFQPSDIARWKHQLGQTDVAQLSQQRLEAARTVLASMTRMFQAGKDNGGLPPASVQLLQAELAVATTEADRQRAIDRHWWRVWQFESLANRQYMSGRAPVYDYVKVLGYLLDAEIRMAEARGGKDK
jgi:hypothetical protein